MKEQEIEIDLKEIWNQLLSHAVIIVLATLIGGLAAVFFSTTMLDKEFQSSTKIYVLSQQDNQNLTYTDLQTGLQLTKDYAELIVSRTVTTRVIAELGLNEKYDDMKDITAEKLAKMIDVIVQQDTRIVEIIVTDTDPARAQDIADAVRVVASEQIYQVMDIEAVNVVDYANFPEGPVSPNSKKNAVIGALVCFVIAAGVLIVRYILDDTIKSPEDVERYLGLSLLAAIPYDESLDTDKNKKGRRRKNAKHTHR